MSLASALAALATPAAAPPIAQAADSEGDQLGAETASGPQVETEIRRTAGGELMRFTVHRVGDGLMFPQHGSHSSHSSHASHASSSPGYGGLPDYVPNLPSAPYIPSAPYVPDPVYAPPFAPAPPAQSTAPAPAAGVDPKYVACTGASNGLGVNDISSQLQQLGLSGNDAASMAAQALTAVLAGGHYCDGYLGSHE